MSLTMPASDTHRSVALQMQALTVGYGQRTILSEIDLEVRAGQVVSLMGGSGSGKTTLLRVATGQIPSMSGSISVLGQDLKGLSRRGWLELRQRMGVLFQHGALFTDLNVFENVAFPLRELRQLPEAEVTQRVLDKLQAVGLRAAAHLRTSEISGGMARRVALARAIVLEPEIIFYDEPFAGLDPVSLGITATLIRSLADTLGCASVLITHDIHESFQISDHVVIVGQGRCLASGTPAALRDTTDPHVRQFLDGAPDGPIAFHYPESEAFERWLARQEARR
jgi:phospholipid/cholesterol/gamma-HCH transport system ATP-binding protein